MKVNDLQCVLDIGDFQIALAALKGTIAIANLLKETGSMVLRIVPIG